MPYLNVTDAKNKLTSIKQREPIAYVEILWYYLNIHKQHKFTNEEFKGVGVKKFEFFVRGKVRPEIKPKV